MAIESPPVAIRLPLGLTLATLIGLTVLIGLGSWQLKRLAWKEDLLARVAQLQAAPPMGLDQALKQGNRAEFTRVSIDCPGLASAPYLQLYAVREGRAGQRLISACPIALPGFDSLLVDRGFVPDHISVRPAINPDRRQPIHLVGVLRRPDRANFVTPSNEVGANRWYVRDIAAMAKALNAPRPVPLFLMAETSTNPDLPGLSPSPLPATIPNRHLEYALTWFGLAAALVGVYLAVLWKRSRG